MKIEKGYTGTTSSSKIVEKHGFKPVYGYVRVSTEGQSKEDKFGLEAQKRAIANYCMENRMAVVKWYIDVESGVKEDRPAMNELLFMDIDEGIDTVVAYKSDRISRNTKMYFYFLYALEKKGLHLDCITEDFDSDNEFADLYRSMMMFVAEQERKNIMYRTVRGKEVKRSEGGFTGGKFPYGYRSNGRKGLELEPEEAWIVLYSFYRYERGAGYKKIATELGKRGYKTRKGTEILPSTIKSILTNVRFYQGYVKQPDGTEVLGKHDRLLASMNVKNYPKGLKPGQSLLGEKAISFLDNRVTGKPLSESERLMKAELKEKNIPFYEAHYGGARDLNQPDPKEGMNFDYLEKRREVNEQRRLEREEQKYQEEMDLILQSMLNSEVNGE